jgi:AcrR family transcriptional regulator
MMKRARKTTSKTLSTPERILAVAEELFAEQSYGSVSLRSITYEAGVNIAAIHYHFGSKRELIEQIFNIRCEPMNQERFRLLASCRAGRGRPPVLEQVLEAYLRPSLIWPGDKEGARRFLKLRATLAHEDAELSRNLIGRHFNQVTGAFLSRIHELLPALSMDELYWRFHFLLGAHYYTLSNPERITTLSGGRVDPVNAEQAIHYMVPFFAAAFRARPAGNAMAFESATVAGSLIGAS